jgi:hypothetical protein
MSTAPLLLFTSGTGESSNPQHSAQQSATRPNVKAVKMAFLNILPQGRGVGGVVLGRFRFAEKMSVNVCFGEIEERGKRDIPLRHSYMKTQVKIIRTIRMMAEITLPPMEPLEAE